ncbi:MAG: metallophosphoesterase family protein [Candidatus Omnitrophota bacterium]|nr:metallophosphoesterase family protein [Candidatus Omnitrophota bacterium]
MRYGIFADIHSNLEALDAVLAAISKENVDEYLCVGDMVGYGASPGICIERVKSITQNIVTGNHEHACAGLFAPSNLNEVAAGAVVWTRKTLPAEELEFFKTLPFVFENKDLVMVHGSLDAPQDFYYLFQPYEAKETFELLNKNICFIGHTHRPKAFVKRGTIISLISGYKVEINPDYKYVVNVGSVGQPRDGDIRASYCTYDTDKQEVEIKRVPYDIETAQKKIIEAGLPMVLAERLAVGK